MTASKSRRKKWFRKRIRAQERMQRKEEFEKAFRAHFVKRGILKD